MKKSPIDLAMAWMEIFFHGENCGQLISLMAPGCTFAGPFAHFDSANEYVDSLVADPPLECSYEILEIVESQNTVVLFYRFTKPGISTIMAQYFRTDDDLISEIRLVFDKEAFSQPGGKTMA